MERQQQQRRLAGIRPVADARSWSGYLVLAILLASVGCKSGAAGNPFQAAPTRVPAPPTRSFQTNGNYYNSPAGASGAPGAPGAAVGTGLSSGTNWSSNPSAVNSANAAGVYTSWLERTGTGYSVRTTPTGATPPPPVAPTAPNGNFRSSAPVDPRFPTTTFADPNSNVRPAEFQQPYPPALPADSGSGLIWRTPQQ